MRGMIIISVSKEDKRSVGEYIKDLMVKQNPFAFMVASALKEAVLNGYCNLDDNINDGVSKIQNQITGGMRGG